MQKKEVEGVQIKVRGAKDDADKIGKDKANAEDKLHKLAAELEGDHLFLESVEGLTLQPDIKPRRKPLVWMMLNPQVYTIQKV